MEENESVTEWVSLLKTGDSFAVRRIWHRYVDQLVHLARRTSRQLASLYGG